MSKNTHRKSQVQPLTKTSAAPPARNTNAAKDGPSPHSGNVTLQVTGMLTTKGPMSVGGIGENAEIDLPFATDGQGRLYIPGTSLAGPLRAWMRSRATEERTRQLWGFQPDKGASDVAEGWASRITVEDAVISNPLANLDIREGVGIDRLTGAAAPTIKYNREIIPAGIQIPFRLRADLLDDANLPVHKALLGDLIDSLERGRLGFGAARSRGMGQVVLRLESLRLHEPCTRKGMLDILRGKPTVSITAEDLLKADPRFEPALLPRMSFTLEWQAVGPVMVKAEQSGLWLDVLPLTGTEGPFRGMVLPGSSLKGALRSMAERIVRTLSHHDSERDPIFLPESSQDGGARREFLKQMDVPLVKWLFGAPVSTTTTETGTQSPQFQQGRSALTVEDCFATRSVPPSLWRELETMEPETREDRDKISRHLSIAGLGSLQPAVHVAVDRWTGGSADGKLFSGLEPMAQRWNPIRIALDLTRIPDKDRFAAVALLFLVMRELSSGRLPLGFGTQRGLGAVKGVDLRVEGDDLVGHEWKRFKQLTLREGMLSDLPPPVRETLNRQWTDWQAQNLNGGQS